MTSATQQATVSTELPIYQQLLDEADPDMRETIIAQQGEGHARPGDTAAASDDALGRHR